MTFFQDDDIWMSFGRVIRDRIRALVRRVLLRSLMKAQVKVEDKCDRLFCL